MLTSDASGLRFLISLLSVTKDKSNSISDDLHRHLSIIFNMTKIFEVTPVTPADVTELNE
jgi:hypothetical protein